MGRMARQLRERMASICLMKLSCIAGRHANEVSPRERPAGRQPADSSSSSSFGGLPVPSRCGVAFFFLSKFEETFFATARSELSSSTRDLLNTLAAIAGQGAGFRSLGDTWADTTTPHGRLMLTVLGGLAEFERELIGVRTSEGRSRAKARGVKLGRTPKLTPHQRREAVRRRDAGETVRDIGRSYNVSHSTISRL
jgi:hypothetical protein